MLGPISALAVNCADGTGPILLLLATKLQKKPAKSPPQPAMNLSPQPKMPTTLLPPLAVVPMRLPRLTWLSRPTQRRILYLTRGLSRSSRTILIHTASMSRRAQAGTSWLRTRETSGIGSSTGPLHHKELFGCNCTCHSRFIWTARLLLEPKLIN